MALDNMPDRPQWEIDLERAAGIIKGVELNHPTFHRLHDAARAFLAYVASFPSEELDAD